jgi:7TM diverse intracellular signalling
VSLAGQTRWLADCTQEGLSPDSVNVLFDQGCGRTLSAWRALHNLCFGRYTYWVQSRFQNGGTDTLELTARLPYARALWQVDSNARCTALPLAFTGDGHSASFATTHLRVPPGREIRLVCRLKSYSIGKEITPTIWCSDFYKNRRQTIWYFGGLMEGLLNGALFGLSLLAAMLFAFRRSAVYGWYALFLALTCLYFWRDFEDDNTLFWSTMAWAGWTEGKVWLAMWTYVAYLQFIYYFLEPVPNKPWLGQILHIASVMLISFGAVDIIVFYDKINYNTGWLFFCALRVVLVPLSGWVLYHIWHLPGPAAAYLRLSASVLVVMAFATCATMLSDTGRALLPVDLNVLPVRIGVLIEAVIYLVALERRELRWLEERIRFDGQRTQALEVQQRQAEQLSAELRRAVDRVKAELEWQTEWLAAARRAQRVADAATAQHVAVRTDMAAALLHSAMSVRFAEVHSCLREGATDKTEEQLMTMAGYLREQLEAQLLVEME